MKRFSFNVQPLIYIWPLNAERSSTLIAWTLLAGAGASRGVCVPFFFPSGQQVELSQQSKKRKMSAEDFTLYFKSHFKGKGWSKQRAEGVDELVFLFNYNLKNFQHIYENNVLIDMESEKDHELELESASSEPSLFEDNISGVIEDELPADYALLEEQWWRPDGPNQDRRSA